MTICDGCDGILYMRDGSENIVNYRHDRHGKEKHGKKITGTDIKRLLLALFQYHLARNEEYLPEIEKALMEKLDSMVKRQLYTTFKTAPTEEEREKARQEYLDKCGMHEDFRW